MGLAARDTLRLEAGLNLYGNDMDETITPYEANLSWTVDLKDAKRDFIGKEARIKQKFDGIKNQLVGLVLQGRGILREKMLCWVDGSQGITTSGSFSPTLAKSIAMARIPVGAYTKAEVEIRGKKIEAEVIALPFIKKKKKV